MWRFFATRLHGDGTETVTVGELPLVDPRVHRALSGPGGIDGTVPEGVALAPLADGTPALYPGATAVYAESGGVIVAGGLLGPQGLSDEGPTRALTTAGFSSWLDGRPYASDSATDPGFPAGPAGPGVDVDPADLLRHAWAHAQSGRRADLGMVVDLLTTPVRVGEEERDVEFTTGDGQDVAFTAGPVRWSWWATHDLGNVVDSLLEDTPIEYLEEHAWAGETIRHRLVLGHPRLGTRRTDLRFTVGENVVVEPTVTPAQWASQVLVLGAGEGRAMRRGEASLSRHDRLHTPVVVVDKSLQSNRACEAAAAVELAWRSGGDDVAQVTVVDHPSAPVGSWRPGDEILLQGSGQGWAGNLHGWFRVLSDQIDVSGDTATLTLTRTGRA